MLVLHKSVLLNVEVKAYQRFWKLLVLFQLYSSSRGQNMIELEDMMEVEVKLTALADL